MSFYQELLKNCEKRLLASSCVCPSAWNNSAPTERIFMKYEIWVFFTICQENSSFIKIGQGKKKYFTWRPLYIFDHMSLSFLTMRNVSNYSCIENQNKYFMFKTRFSKIVPFMIMWEKFVKPGGSQMKIWRIRIACWVPKTTSKHSKYIYSIYRFNAVSMTIKIYKYRQNTTKFIILYHFWTTCFDSLESSSGPLVNWSKTI